LFVINTVENVRLMMLMTFLSCLYFTVCSTGKCRVVIHMYYIKCLFVAAELVRYYQENLMLICRLAVSVANKAGCWWFVERGL